MNNPLAHSLVTQTLEALYEARRIYLASEGVETATIVRLEELILKLLEVEKSG